MDVAEVRIWNTMVGAVAWNEQSGYASFEFEPAFLRTGWNLAPITMPLSRVHRVYGFAELGRQRDAFDTFKGLPGLVADSLPDRYGNALIATWLAQQGRPTDSLNPIELLCFVGSRAMGALEFKPVRPARQERAMPLEIDSLVQVAQDILNERSDFSSTLDPNNQEAFESIVRVGTSAGGARAKAVIAYNEQTGEVRSGQTQTPKGFEHWLLKLDGVHVDHLASGRGYGRVEYAYYLMARDCGISMMPSRLLVEHERAHFMTKRFDRDAGNVKHHVQTFCAMIHADYNKVGAYGYEVLLQTMRQLDLDYAAAEQMILRMIFNVMARNCDDHTKNTSFLLRQNGRWELAPAYDLCHAYQPNHRWVGKHAMSVNGKREDIERTDIIAVARSAGIKARPLIDRVADVVSNWSHYASKAEINTSLSSSIASTHRIL